MSRPRILVEPHPIGPRWITLLAYLFAALLPLGLLINLLIAGLLAATQQAEFAVGLAMGAMAGLGWVSVLMSIMLGGLVVLNWRPTSQRGRRGLALIAGGLSVYWVMRLLGRFGVFNPLFVNDTSPESMGPALLIFSVITFVIDIVAVLVVAWGGYRFARR